MYLFAVKVNIIHTNSLYEVLTEKILDINKRKIKI